MHQGRLYQLILVTKQQLVFHIRFAAQSDWPVLVQWETVLIFVFLFFPLHYLQRFPGFNERFAYHTVNSLGIKYNKIGINALKLAFFFSRDLIDHDKDSVWTACNQCACWRNSPCNQSVLMKKLYLWNLSPFVDAEVDWLFLRNFLW